MTPIEYLIWFCLTLIAGIISVFYILYLCDQAPTAIDDENDNIIGYTWKRITKKH